jgi:hypothetical protein
MSGGVIVSLFDPRKRRRLKYPPVAKILSRILFWDIILGKPRSARRHIQP